MKPAAAFAVGLWTGAAVMAGVGLFYLQLTHRHRADVPAASEALWESRFQALQQDHVKLAAETQRLRQTVAELRAQLPVASAPPPSTPAETARLARQLRVRPAPDAEVEPWILAAVQAADPQALARLEQAAAADPAALDALALLAPLDNAEALTRVWLLPGLDPNVRQRATLLLAAVIETHPQPEEWIQSLAGNLPLQEAALAGLSTTHSISRLARQSGARALPALKPDHALRLRLVEMLRAGLTDESLAAQAERVRERLLQQSGESAAVAP